MEPAESGLPERSTLDCSPLLTVHKERVLGRVGTLAAQAMTRVDAALKISLALD